MATPTDLASGAVLDRVRQMIEAEMAVMAQEGIRPVLPRALEETPSSAMAASLEGDSGAEPPRAGITQLLSKILEENKEIRAVLSELNEQRPALLSRPVASESKRHPASRELPTINWSEAKDLATSDDPVERPPLANEDTFRLPGWKRKMQKEHGDQQETRRGLSESNRDKQGDLPIKANFDCVTEALSAV